LRTIESNSDRIAASDKEIGRNDGMALSDLRHNVRHLVEQELPENVIVDILSEKASVPRFVIRKEIERAKMIIDETKDKK
jgi:hypothetical protein